MRLKRQKKHRKAVKFYKACYGFRHPYKVLCDGTFIHHLLTYRLTPADHSLSNLLGDSVTLFTTKCAIVELKRLGKSYSESIDAAHSLITARCDHDKIKNADACIMDVVGENNSEHFFVATQDAHLRQKLQLVPGVPLVFGLRNSLLLEKPSAVQLQFAKASEEERLHMSESEYKMLKKRTERLLKTEDIRASSDGNEDVGDQESAMKAVRKTHTVHKRLGVKDGPQFKRKKAKGPNPLSCKKKKNPVNPNPVLGKERNDKDGAVRSRSRKRKRSRGGKKLVESDV
ncbi:Fcf1 domain-containing protein [Cephalotus follicularis]|uniref:Fcf1 domain-containing protein n=1 Tax=Cephalotus follicularis TaxID=3775 RepID=A0A1Q3DFP4_CEPFO|nr:Fcf1 domain-containing protein [Cephalotus follicularis]